MIKYGEIISPLQILSQYDIEILSILFTTLFTSIFKQMGDENDSVVIIITRLVCCSFGCIYSTSIHQPFFFYFSNYRHTKKILRFHLKMILKTFLIIQIN